MPTALLINKFIPPDQAPTAVLLGELGKALEDAGFVVDYLGDSSEYRQQELSLYQRAGRELLLHGKLVCRGIAARRPDLVIALSSPPGLLLSAVPIGLRHRAPVFHWCMDVFPEVAASLGVIRENGLLHRTIRGLMHLACRRCHAVVALDTEMKRVLDRAGIECRVQPPWPPLSLQQSARKAASALSPVPDPADRRTPPTTQHPASPPSQPSTKPPYWLYSGNLGRVHEWETLLRAQKILEEKGVPLTLIFQGSGAERSRAREMAESLGLRRCEWRNYLEPDELPASFFGAAALAVTQRPETEGLLHPSKLVPIRLIPRPLIWIGSITGEIADHLRKRPHTCLATPGEAGAVADFLIAHSEIPFKTPAELGAEMREFSARAESLRQEGLRRWVQWCRESCGF